MCVGGETRKDLGYMKTIIARLDNVFPSPCNTSSKRRCRQRPIRFVCSETHAYELHIADLIGQYFTSAF